MNSDLHKTCPRCGHRTVVQMPSCQRCGHAFAGETTTVVAPRPISGSPPRRPIRVQLWSAAAAVLFVTVVVGYGVYSAARKPAPTSSIVVSLPAPKGPEDETAAVPPPPVTAARSVPAEPFRPPVTSAPAPRPPAPAPPVVATRLPASPAPSPGLFRERPSPRLTPTLRITNESHTRMLLTLTVRNGDRVDIVIPAYGEARREVAPGHYLLSVQGEDRHILPAQGDATFLRYKEYEGNFMVGSAEDQRPVHLGD